MVAISDTLRFIIWIIAGITAALVAIITILVEPNLSYFLRQFFPQLRNRRGRPPTRKPIQIWLTYIVSTVITIFATAIASSAPELPKIPTAITPTQIPSQVFTLNPNRLDIPPPDLPLSTQALTPISTATIDELKNIALFGVNMGLWSWTVMTASPPSNSVRSSAANGAVTDAKALGISLHLEELSVYSFEEASLIFIGVATDVYNAKGVRAGGFFEFMYYCTIAEFALDEAISENKIARSLVIISAGMMDLAVGAAETAGADENKISTGKAIVEELMSIKTEGTYEKIHDTQIKILDWQNQVKKELMTVER